MGQEATRELAARERRKAELRAQSLPPASNHRCEVWALVFVGTGKQHLGQYDKAVELFKRAQLLQPHEVAFPKEGDE